MIHNLAEDVSLDFSDHGTQIAFTVPNDLPPLGERPLKGVPRAGRRTDDHRPRRRDRLPAFPVGITATADHVVVALNTAGRTLLGDVVGRPVCATLPHPDLLAALDAAFHEARPGSVPLPAPTCDGRLRADPRRGAAAHDGGGHSGAERARTTALQRLPGCCRARRRRPRSPGWS